MTDSPHPLAAPSVRRHSLPDRPTGGEIWLRDPSPAVLAAVALGLVVVVLASIVSVFATPRRPDLPPPLEGQAILASPTRAGWVTEEPAESYAPPSVSFSSRAVAPIRRATPSSRPTSPKPSTPRSKPPVVGPGDLAPLPASRESTLRSHGGGPSTFVDFVNAHGSTVVVHWINYEGRRQQYAVLRPGQSYRQQTYVGHPWVVADERGRGLVCFEPARHTLRAVVR
ncbi:hypothetical protein AB0B20_27260 [Micromonospora sp. NPDC049151]|uniref:VHL beta domain-containing protein n=1 Tax=Micromonospora sp. NPDC049151 TaxID=3155648 RepID=UPI0033FB1C69